MRNIYELWEYDLFAGGGGQLRRPTRVKVGDG